MDEGEEADMETVRAQFPAWHPWIGVNGWCYASRRAGLATVTLRAPNWTTLAETIGKREKQWRSR